MEPLDGNAIAGQLAEYFDAEMTGASGACAGCGAESIVAELQVWLSGHGPGAVARCPSCGNVVLVVVEIRRSVRITDERFHWT
jgi:uncharacterized Zn finger protein